MSDLTARAHELSRDAEVGSPAVRSAIIGELADRIEALETERDSFERLWKRLDASSEKHFGGLIEDRIEAVEALESALAARDAVIAEALARSEDGAHSAETPAFTLIAVRAILSRVPQGAAEPERKFNVLDSRRPWVEGAAEPNPSVDALLAAAALPALPLEDDPTARLLGLTEPWTDPKPWITPGSLSAPGNFRHADRRTGRDYLAPRSREQYDAEEGNR